MKRKHFLAAELFNYSFDNYKDHLGIGNVRYDRLMPEDALLLERAESEGWPDKRLADESDFSLDDIPQWRKKFREAKKIVDAKTPAKSFRLGVTASIQYAMQEGLNEENVHDLVTQICYRAADLSCLLKKEGRHLHEYSRELRKED